MNCTECIAQLHDYADGELPSADARAVDSHLAVCPACRAESDSLRALRRATAALPREIAPQRDLWPELAAQLAQSSPAVVAGSGNASLPPAREAAPPHSDSRASFTWFLPFAVAASIALLATLGKWQPRVHADGPGWTVESLAGAPRVGARPLQGEGRFRVGQWLETDATSRARVDVGNIGQVSVEPNSRLRLVDAAKVDHRLELARGTLHAFIIAPPRVFLVDTPSATAVDLGCAYTLTVDDDGGSTLHVTSGYVSLEEKGRVSIIPRGNVCRTKRGFGPGTPRAEDAPAALRAALERFDFARDTSEATLRQILAEARDNDAVTLWHLLSRTQKERRAAVFDRLAHHHPPPHGVTREGILRGEAAMLEAWAIDLGIGTLGYK